MWEELYERYRGELVRYAARLCGSGEEAEDLVQEVFLRALQNADTVDRKITRLNSSHAT